MEYTILYHARNEMENKVCWYCIVYLYCSGFCFSQLEVRPKVLISKFYIVYFLVYCETVNREHCLWFDSDRLTVYLPITMKFITHEQTWKPQLHVITVALGSLFFLLLLFAFSLLHKNSPYIFLVFTVFLVSYFIKKLIDTELGKLFDSDWLSAVQFSFKTYM